MQFSDITLLLLLLIICAMAMTMVFHCLTMVPYVPTPEKVLDQMLDFAKLKGDESIYDLGAGDGRLLVLAKKKFPGLKATGFEISPMVYLLGRISMWRHKTDATFRCVNFFKQDLSDADCIYLYLMPEAMRLLAPKFDRELKPGTKVISYAFTFKDRKPSETREVNWLSGKRNLLMYVWPAKGS